MAKIKQRTFANDLVIDGVSITSSNKVTLENGSVVQESLPLLRTTISLSDEVITVTDEGANGGYFGLELVSLPAVQFQMAGLWVTYEITAADGTGVQADAADVELAIASAANAGGGALAAGEKNLVLASDTFTLSGGAAAAETETGPAAPIYIAASGSIYLNGYVPTAGIAATGTITMNLLLKVALIDLGA